MENPEKREEKALVFAPNTLSLGCSLNNGVIWGHGRGGMHFFFSDQGPLLKGGGDVGGEYPCERVFDFLVRLF